MQAKHKLMDDEDMLFKQVQMTTAATKGTTVWVYRNTVYGYPWYTDVRKTLEDPAYADWSVSRVRDREMRREARREYIGWRGWRGAERDLGWQPLGGSGIGLSKTIPLAVWFGVAIPSGDQSPAAATHRRRG